MTLIAAKWSVDDYQKMIATGLLDGRSVELINGAIIQMVPAGIADAFCCRGTAKYLRTILGDRAEISEAHPISLPSDSEPEPDIAVLKTPDTLYQNRHPQPDDIFWLIEIANTTLVNDLGVKRELYAQAGISEYWVMNLQTSELKVFRDLSANEYRSEISLDSGTISPLAFPDLAIDLSRLFR
ncbi:Uma2 family endonuclease [Chamaesiphon sp. VAR_69_metabat_338]|uniref:Uma2 family endonuclease n=1 Tax=Chamaesiphon sp. VAR_69_metabat_338 TaxID=2964704 RepID=UPI00286DA9B4|nr:Uma2 family endonuclease [Chamaesiphon sp. VAR_69_metabat_338]